MEGLAGELGEARRRPAFGSTSLPPACATGGPRAVGQPCCVVLQIPWRAKGHTLSVLGGGHPPLHPPATGTATPFSDPLFGSHCPARRQFSTPSWVFLDSSLDLPFQVKKQGYGIGARGECGENRFPKLKTQDWFDEGKKESQLCAGGKDGFIGNARILWKFRRRRKKKNWL